MIPVDPQNPQESFIQATLKISLVKGLLMSLLFSIVLNMLFDKEPMSLKL